MRDYLVIYKLYPGKDNPVDGPWVDGNAILHWPHKIKGTDIDEIKSYILKGCGAPDVYKQVVLLNIIKLPL